MRNTLPEAKKAEILRRLGSGEPVSVSASYPNERGHISELRALQACEMLRTKLEWLLSARRGTKDEDRQGIDIVVSITVNGFPVDIPLQVKSSKTQLRRFRRRVGLRWYPAVVVGDRMQLEVLGDLEKELVRVRTWFEKGQP